jgi:HEAT repeat protein
MSSRTTIAALVLITLTTLAAGCSTVQRALGESSSTPPKGAVLVDVQTPPPGAKWTVNEIAHDENTDATTRRTVTWTVLGEGLYEGRPVIRFSDGTNVHVQDRASHSWVAVLDKDGRELITYRPSDGMFSPPLWVGKEWVARYAKDDRVNKRALYELVAVWKVAAVEDVQVPAGKFKAYRVEAWPDERDTIRKRTYWYSPDAKAIVKETADGTAEPYKTGVSRDRVRYTMELAQTPSVETATPAQRAETPEERAKNLAQTLATDRDPFRRLAAAEALGQIDGALAPLSVTPLGGAAKNDADARVRFAASRALMRLVETLPEAGSALVTAAQTSPEARRALGEAALNPQVRLRALGLIARVGASAREIVPVVLESLRDETDPRVRVAAANAMQKIGLTPEELPILVTALRDPSADVRDAVATALKDRMGQVRTLIEPDLQDSAVEIRKRATEALGPLGHVAPGEILPILRGSLEDREAVVRVAAVRALREIGDLANGALREALKHDEPDVRAAAAEAIAIVSPRTAVSGLVDLLGDSDASVRASAVRALGSLGAEARNAADALQKIAQNDASADVRALAARALDAIGAR